MKSKEQVIAEYNVRSNKGTGVTIVDINVPFDIVLGFVFKVMLSTLISGIILGVVVGIPVLMIYRIVT